MRILFLPIVAAALLAAGPAAAQSAADKTVDVHPAPPAAGAEQPPKDKKAKKDKKDKKAPNYGKSLENRQDAEHRRKPRK